MKRIVLIGLAVLVLTGCKDEDALMKNPEIQSIGEFNGCQVQYVNRGYASNSFYIANCGNANAVTWMQPSGKSQIQRSVITINGEIEKLQNEKAAIETKEKALGKLTPEEKKALGIKG